MDRWTDADPSDCMAVLAQQMRDAAAVKDADLTERIDADGHPTTDPSGILADRSDREHVAYYQTSDGRWLPSALKVGDDVLCGGFVPVRVAGPARGRSLFSGYYEPWFGSEMLVPIDVQYVSDRAPLDSSETAMPVIPVEGEAA